MRSTVPPVINKLFASFWIQRWAGNVEPARILTRFTMFGRVRVSKIRTRSSLNITAINLQSNITLHTEQMNTVMIRCSHKQKKQQFNQMTHRWCLFLLESFAFLFFLHPAQTSMKIYSSPDSPLLSLLLPLILFLNPSVCLYCTVLKKKIVLPAAPYYFYSYPKWRPTTKTLSVPQSLGEGVV